VLFSGCIKQLPPKPERPLKDASIESLLMLFQARLKEIGPFKALMEISGDFGARGQHRFQAAFRSEGRKSRIRGFDLFGGTLFELRLDDRFFSLKLPSEPLALEAELEQFEALAGEKIPFGSLDLLSWLKRGGIPDIRLQDIPALEKRPEDFILYLFSVSGGMARLHQKISIERSDFRVTKVELFDPSGLPRGLLTFEDYRKLQGRALPFSVRGVSGGVSLSMKFLEASFEKASPGNLP